MSIRDWNHEGTKRHEEMMEEWRTPGCDVRLVGKHTSMTKFNSVFLRVLRASVVMLLCSSAHAAPLRAGAFALNITPTEFPVIVNGGFVEAVATKANDRLHARALVLESGQAKI